MSERLTRAVVFPGVNRALFTVFLAVLLGAPAWAQRGGRPAGGASMPMGAAPMSMPRMSMPRMSSPQMSSPMRPSAMPQARPFSPASQPRFSQPAARLGKPQPVASATIRVRPTFTSSAEHARMPVYTPMTSTTFRSQVSGIRAYQNQYYATAYFSPAYLAGYGWDPFLSGGGFFGDPFEYAFLTGADCFAFSPFDSLSFNPYSAQFASPFLLNAAIESGYFCGSPFSTGFFEPFGAFGYSPAFYTGQINPFVFGLNSSFLDAFALSDSAAAAGASSTISEPLTGLIATSDAGSALGFNDSGSLTSSFIAGEPASSGSFSADASSAASSDSAFAANTPAASRPITLVFSNGLTEQASEYWLGSDSNLHYANGDKFQMSVPLDRLDLAATMKANSGNGVQFLLPSSAESAPAANPQ